MGARRGADKEWARAKRDSMLSQILRHVAPRPFDLVVIGGNFDGMHAWKRCSYGTPMLKASDGEGGGVAGPTIAIVQWLLSVLRTAAPRPRPPPHTHTALCSASSSTLSSTGRSFTSMNTSRHR